MNQPNPLAGIPAPEVLIVDDDADEVYCDGGSRALGHPAVWYSFDGRSRVTCQYCDREFIKRSHSTLSV